MASFRAATWTLQSPRQRSSCWLHSGSWLGSDCSIGDVLWTSAAFDDGIIRAGSVRVANPGAEPSGAGRSGTVSGCGFGRLLRLELGNRRRRRSVAESVAERQDPDGVADADVAGRAHHREEAIAGHDAVAGLVVDRALGVADLADLQDGGVPDFDLAADRQREEVDAGRGDVLGEVTRPNLEALRHHLRDRLLPEQRHLTVPVAGVGVAFKPSIEDKRASLSALLAYGLAHAQVDRDDDSRTGQLHAHESSSRTHRPDLPPSLSSSPRPSTVMPRSTALHMSYSVSAATEAAVSASISTPVAPSVSTAARMRTPSPRGSKSTEACVNAIEWQRGMRSLVFFAAVMPATRATPSTSPLGACPS